MVDDLCKNHLQKGLKRKVVLAMLGQSNAEDVTGNDGPFDIYLLVDSHSFWQDLNIWLRYRTTEPMLILEYGTSEDRLIDIRIE